VRDITPDFPDLTGSGTTERRTIMANFKGRRGAALATAAILASSALLAGCSDSEADGASADGGTAVGYAAKFLKDDFQVLLLDEFKADAKDGGMDVFSATDANSDVAKQVSDIQNMLASGAQAIVMVPVDPAGVVPAVEAANAKNVPVFFIDDAPVGGEVAATVRADNVGAGVQAAEEMVRRLEADDCWPSDCTVLELQGGLDTPNGLDRSKGFADTMKEKAPEVTVTQRPTEWTADMAADAAQNVLTQNPDLDGIFMASELMASAVNAQLKTVGRDAAAGDPEAVIRVAIDGTPAGLKLIRDGQLDATVSQPLSGYASTVADLIKKAVAGEDISSGEIEGGQIVDTDFGPQYQLDATLVTSDNVDDEGLWGNQAG
jgi:ABC-type sugar transport system substrate-binding protein